MSPPPHTRRACDAPAVLERARLGEERMRRRRGMGGGGIRSCRIRLRIHGRGVQSHRVGIGKSLWKEMDVCRALNDIAPTNGMRTRPDYRCTSTRRRVVRSRAGCCREEDAGLEWSNDQ
jgi:hypothetical protein